MKNWSKKENLKSFSEFYSNFKAPDNIYRPVPFWSLNDDLQPDEMARQMKMMAEKGLGGSFMHARSGLKTPYLSERWMECIESAVEQSVKDNTYAWLYDENGWPSGFAGGEVTAKGEEYWQKHLVYKEISRDEADFGDKFLLGCYGLIDGTAEKLDESTINNRNYEKIIEIKYEFNRYYVDILNKDVIREFINTTHERYKDKFGSHFGKNIPGIFTDEPQHSVGGKPPYSYILPEEFKKEHGYDVHDILPVIFIDCNVKTQIGVIGCMQARYDFRKTVSRLLTDSFTKQIGKWCTENNLALTGHFISEDSLNVQVDCSSGVMASYEYMQVPGIDWLMRFVGGILTAKQVTSAANQMDRRFCISETFGCTGWNISFEDLKWLAEYQYVLGVNMMCQHLEWYSMRGSRKRDYPPTMYFQQPWWDKYNMFNDYFARLGSVISDNRLVCDILIVHPLHSAWMLFKPFTVGDLDDKLNCLMRTVLGNHFDFELADEIMMSHIGDVVEQDGKVYFKMGSCLYSTVIIPSSYNLDRTTLELLYKFSEKGGLLISYDRIPVFVDGRIPAQGSVEEQMLTSVMSKAYKTSDDASEVIRVLDSNGKRLISVTDQNNAEADNVYVRIMESIDGCTFIYAVNHSEDRSGTYKAALSGNKKVYLLDLQTGKTQKYPAVINDGITEFDIVLFSQGSKLFVTEDINTSIIENEANKYICSEIFETEIITESLYNIKAQNTELNSLTVDYLDYSIDNEAYTENVPAIELQNMLVKLGKEADVKLRYNFNISDTADLSKFGEIYFACEDPQNFTFEINGKDMRFTDCGYWKDPCIRKCSIKDYVVNGRNSVTMKIAFEVSDEVYHLMTDEGVHECAKNNITFDTEIESVYILGDFGVYSNNEFTYDGKMVFNDGGFYIDAKKDSYDLTKTLESGYPFYSGNFILADSFDIGQIDKSSRYYLDFGKKPYAVLCEVKVNGIKAADIAWAPYKTDITELLMTGKNDIEIILYGSGRNAFGPHHHVLGEPVGVGPASFEKYKGWIDWSIEDPIIWRDRYCFIKFGLKEPVKIIKSK